MITVMPEAGEDNVSISQLSIASEAMTARVYSWLSSFASIPSQQITDVSYYLRRRENHHLWLSPSRPSPCVTSHIRLLVPEMASTSGIWYVQFSRLLLRMVAVALQFSTFPSLHLKDHSRPYQRTFMSNLVLGLCPARDASLRAELVCAPVKHFLWSCVSISYARQPLLDFIQLLICCQAGVSHLDVRLEQTFIRLCFGPIPFWSSPS